MFYIKETLSESTAINIEITDENVYGKCPVCGCEVSVDLVDLFAEGEVDLYSTQVLCDHCSKNVIKKEG